MEIIVGERILNKAGETGVITIFDGQYITVTFQSRTAMFKSDAFEQGHIKYENADLQSRVQERIAQAKLEEDQKAEARIDAEKAKQAQKAQVAKAPAASNAITVESSVLLIDPAPVYLNSVAKNDRLLVQEIFNECEKDTGVLFESFQPKMVYPKFTSRSRSKYCVGFLTKYLGSYVFRVFSRNDIYKRRVKTGITVLENNTAEVFRVIQVNGRIYYFTKNITVSMGHYNNNTASSKWCGYRMGGMVFLNEVICNCDCGYLNGFISDKHINVEAFLFVDLLFLALVNNKAEIVFKNKAFASTNRIGNLADYLEEFTSKQIDFASKNNVLHTLPFIKKYGISDIDLLRDLEGVMRNKRGDSIYNTLTWMLRILGFDRSELDKRLMNFIKKVEHFNAAVYYDYLWELHIQPDTTITVQDIFDKNYIERHNTMRTERLVRNATDAIADEQKESEEYRKIAKELSWIDREENGYFIMIPKTVADFRIEGDIQHNCVYKLRYYRDVMDRESVIVFLRQEKHKPYVTIEFDYNTFEVLQALGKYNKKIDPDLYRYIVDLGKQLYYEKHTHQ